MILVAKTRARAERYITDMGLVFRGGTSCRVVLDDPHGLDGVGRTDTVVVLDRQSLHLDVEARLGLLAQLGTPVINVEPEQCGEVANSTTAELVHEVHKRIGALPGRSVQHLRLQQDYIVSIKVRPWDAPPEFTSAEEAQTWLDKRTEERERYEARSPL